MRLFLDANVVFSAAHSPDGRARALFRLARKGQCELLSSPHAIEEARRNIRIKYPEKSDDLEALVSELHVTPEATPPAVAWARKQSLPLEDAPILAAAVEAAADLLVTGDRTHFGRFFGKSLRGVGIATPAKALRKLLSG
jgi:predicted nucleic acid-binding protein